MDPMEQAKNIVFKAISQVNQLLLEEEQIGESLDTVLIGSKAAIDSLAIVNLIVALEAIIQEELNITTSLGDELMLDNANTPFSTVKSLIQYIEKNYLIK